MNHVTVMTGAMPVGNLRGLALPDLIRSVIEMAVRSNVVPFQLKKNIFQLWNLDTEAGITGNTFGCYVRSAKYFKLYTG